MSKLIVLSGVCGTGKTYKREHDPELMDLPYVDIADYRHEYPALDAMDRLEVMLGDVRPVLEASRKGVIVEGFFLEGTPSRERISEYAEHHGADLEIVECWFPKAECIANVYRKPGITQQEASRHVALINRLWRDQ